MYAGMYVCMYVLCMYVMCMYVCMYVHSHVYICVCMFVKCYVSMNQVVGTYRIQCIGTTRKEHTMLHICWVSSYMDNTIHKCIKNKCVYLIYVRFAIELNKITYKTMISSVSLLILAYYVPKTVEYNHKQFHTGNRCCEAIFAATNSNSKFAFCMCGSMCVWGHKRHACNP